MILPPAPVPTPTLEQSHARVTRTPGAFSGSASPETPTRGRRPATLAKTLLALVTAAVTTVVVAAPAAAKLVWIPRGGHRIAAYVQPGRRPAIVLSHGFPDNHHLYDRVVPLLKGHEVVTFDFLGWGRSSKPSHYSYTFARQEQDLNAVIDGLHLGRVVLVAHDASVPAALNWTLDHPGRVASMILSNGFYAPVPGSGPPRWPRSSRSVSTRIPHRSDRFPSGTAYGLNSLMNGLSTDPRLLDDLLTWQESTFIENPAVARQFIPLFTQQFLTRPSSLGPLRSLAGNLFAAVAHDASRLPSLTLSMSPPISSGAHATQISTSTSLVPSSKRSPTAPHCAPRRPPQRHARRTRAIRIRHQVSPRHSEAVILLPPASRVGDKRSRGSSTTRSQRRLIDWIRHNIPHGEPR